MIHILPKKKLKILYYTNVDWSFVTHRLDLAKEAIREGFDVHLLCNVTSKKKIIEGCGITLHESFLSRGFNIFKDIIVIIKLIKIIIKIKPDIIHSVSNKNILIGGFISRIFRVKITILAVSGLGYLYMNKNLFTKFSKIILHAVYNMVLKNKKSYVIVQNKSDFNIIHSILRKNTYKENIILIPGSGVDINYFKPLANVDGNYSIQENDNITVSLVARMLYDKGIKEFIDAAKNLSKKYSKVEFNLYGDPDLGNPTSIPIDKLSEWNSYININWKGYKSNTLSIYNTSDIIVLPSYREGMPKTILEAASCGKPSIVTDVPGCKDAIIPNKTGLLVKLFDTHDLQNKIEFLINNADIRNLMGVEARKFAVSKFDVKNINAVQIKLYNN